LDARDLMQGIQNDSGLRFRSHEKVKARQNAAKNRAGCACSIENGTVVLAEADIAALQEELDAVAQRIIEGDLGNRGIDGDLELRSIELLQRSFDDPVAFLVGVDQQCIVDDIGRNSHAGEKRVASVA